MSVGVVIPAAGQGKRMGSKVSKPFLLLDGQPILVHTLRLFETHPQVDEIILVMKKEEVRGTEEMLRPYGFAKVKAIVEGGRERQESVYKGLQYCQSDWVFIHDAVRPFVTHEALDRLIKEVKATKAVILGVPVKDTIKQINSDGWVTNTPARSELISVQTPQGFSRDLIIQAHQKALEYPEWATDDSMLIEQLGFPVKVVEGEYNNIKITTPEDLVLAEKIWEIRRVEV
ncbi:2-C-methyl-D-erythritol 4-phosphate cytidylyltransferase [Thermoactinomyces sp. DSM 45892]|uniref:2-C-methyl-D-erythritol 4-phosphate cytidylyltransferase n=1 Tax=Thermoactinomyces sp. DSM 45892 TaxID=1882753 RepID=UPI000894FEF3|nr:2-C-methyl-D-erythritol 4-phosphate cytidylyltransferase [Thermoactinomyces sp. DSM 45892]SDY93803.1 2-C-methyl-D-erythritol 4-phosphate cytidylyltransferase [Thermoactinomyces sp. DSM 45892]